VVILPADPTCGACPGPAVVQWQRRPTDAELAVLVAAEMDRRLEIRAAAGPDQPLPPFGPLPTAADTTVAAWGCAGHAITLDVAAQIHAADCQAPHPDHLPGCNCDPEPHPEPEELGGPKVTLPTGWTIPTPTAVQARAFASALLPPAAQPLP
jgi:hypothetical protein